MNPDAASLWRAPRWALALLLACLAMLGPFSIDTYLPAFSGIARSLGATPVEMQQTLSSYLAGFALMNLFHGAISDSVGRRPVILWGIAVFTLASAGCALAQTIGQLVFFRLVQGLSAGAGMVVSRTIIRDMFPPADAQRVMAQVTIWFGIAPAVAPIVGGLLIVHGTWHAIFWVLAGFGALLWAANQRWLPETLHADQRQPFSMAHLLRGYVALGGDLRFLALALAGGVPFNGMFVYVLSSPVFLGEHLQLAPTRFFLLFMLVIGGIMAGAWCSGRLAGRMPAAASGAHRLHGDGIGGTAQPGADAAAAALGLVGAAAAGGVLVRLGADDAGGHADGARPGARAPRHGVVAAGLHRRHRQRRRRRRRLAVGDAFGRRAGLSLAVDDRHRAGRLVVGTAEAAARLTLARRRRPVPTRRGRQSL